MANAKKDTIKAKRNRARVNFHREWKSIMVKQNQSNQQIAHSSNFTSNANSNMNTGSSAFQGHHFNVDFQELDIRERLRRWALRYNISNCAVTDLLKILILLGIHNLPKDGRTLLQTPRFIKMISLSNGKLWYAIV